MGLLDDVAGIAGNILDGDGENSKLVNVVIQFLINKFGGLQGLIDNFKSNGMEDAVSSWIKTGPNKEITQDQLEKGLGKENVDEIAKQADMPRETVTEKLSEILPNLVDKLTPNAEIPDKNMLEKALLIFKRSL